MSTLTTRLRDIESQLRVGAEEFQQQVQATLLSAEDLAEVMAAMAANAPSRDC